MTKDSVGLLSLFGAIASVPSSIAHASVAILLSPLLGVRALSKRVIALAAVGAVVPDLDALGRPFGRGDLALLGGHRATTHSLLFVAAAALVITFGLRSVESRTRLRVAGYVALVVASHGLLDALATYGEGVALLAPFSSQRWKFGWQPFSGLLSEVLLLWLPSAFLFVLWLKPRFQQTDITARAA